VDTALFKKLAKVEWARFSQQKPKFFVWPIGTLYRGGAAVHWNVFVFERGTKEMLRFDPSHCVGGGSRYVYSDAIVTSMALVSGTPVVMVPLNNACQVDQCGLDHFCQTWVILFVDFYLHSADPRKLATIQTFDFYHLGKPLMKTWLRCVSRHLYHGREETWYDYAKRHFPAMFHFDDGQKLRRAPNLSAKQCWRLLSMK